MIRVRNAHRVDFTTLPSGWNQRRMKAAVKQYQHEKNKDPDPIVLSLTKRGIQVKKDLAFGKSTDNYVGHQIVRRGQFVFTPRDFDATPILCGVSEYEGCISNLYIVFDISSNVIPKYLEYYFYGLKYGFNYFEKLSFGMRYSFNRTQFENIPLILPPYKTQLKIADYIDRETARIDQLIKKKQRLFKVLEEKLFATITAAVTKGLEPNVPMTNSGIEWIGKIPAYWKVLPLKLLTNSIQTGPFGSQFHSEEYVDNETPVINPSNIKKGRLHPDLSCTVGSEIVKRLARHKLQAGEIVFGRRGEMGRCALVSANETGWLCGTGCLKLQLNGRTLPEFTLNILQTPGTREILQIECVGSTMDNLNEAILSRIPVPIPPIEEQATILSYVKSKNSCISRIQDEINESSNRLKEFRSALITAAVTGQIDVDTWSRRGNTDRHLDAIEEEMGA